VRACEIAISMGAMKKCLPVAALALCPLLAEANDGLELALKSKSMAAASAQAVSAPASSSRGKDPLPEMLLRAENEQGVLGRDGCRAAASDLCYDIREGRLVYGGARADMPHIEGLRAESVSLRHDGFVLRYSFR
jgi:hypothetical protein